MNKNKILIVILLLLITAGSYYLFTKNSTQVMNIITSKHIISNSDYLFETIRGKKFALDVADKKFKIKGMKNKIVFLKVFGWECKFCKREIPELVKLKNQLGDTFEIIAIEAQQHSKEESLEKIKEYGINYHIVAGDEQKEFYAYLQEKYGWTGIIPLTIVISKEGDVLAFELGAKSYSLSELMQASLLNN